jgi:membrane-associated phospholipid phosphatase
MGAMVACLPLIYPVLAGLGFLALLALVVGRWSPLVRLDSSVTDAAREFGQAHLGWVRALRLSTDTAGTDVFFAVGLAGVVVLLLARRAYAQAAFIASVFIVVPVLWALMHVLIHRPRPVHGFVMITSSGFPSGHASHAAAAGLVAILLLWPRLRRRGRFIVVVIAVAFGLAIGISRVALVAHWPTDVLGSWLLVLTAVPLLARATALLARRNISRES